MPYLILEEGSPDQEMIELDSDLILLGRHPDCAIRLNDIAVSRQHARIVKQNEQYFIEDLHSRNQTLVNGQAIQGKLRLRNKDCIKICGFSFRFRRSESSSTLLSPVGGHDSQETMRLDSRTAVDGEGSSSKIIQEALLNEGKFENDTAVIQTLKMKRPGANPVMDPARAETKLKAILEISKALGATLKLQPVMQTIMRQAFALFPQTDSVFLIMKDRQTGELTIPASKHQSHIDPKTARASKTMVELAMNSREAVLSQNSLEDSRFTSSESMQDMDASSTICVPLVEASGTVLGALQLTTSDLRETYTDEDLDVLLSVGSQVSLAIQNAYQHELLLKQHELERELEFAMRVQLGFLPSERPKVDGYEFCDYYEAAKHVGGDYFDYIHLPNERLAIVLGDVAGKGVPAALFMARLLSSTRNHLMTEISASATIEAMNAELSASDLGFRFITLVMLVLDLKTNKISLVNAGHMPPLLIDAKGEIRALGKEISGMPLGVNPDQKFRELEFELQKGDSLVLYTDGITESMNPDRELFGTHRLFASLHRSFQNMDQLIKQVVQDVDAFAHQMDQSDDMCLVALHRET
ncbi:Phosphoserine phosphatase RsbU [Polystyrenella longa]|uniref:Phosphoserine phosphatase RsbU n=1 Tax=Polystyrenella longa TaxID=2528007 RepID=A0A518CGV9_9PLAN|nr:SpoIIE family protein phosphatase [Polystyrenella longa]QDU78466.1 Phosphoserine phosphatase RsbU [Polystyrenella longa]